MIAFFSDSCFSNSKILFLRMFTHEKLSDVTALPLKLFSDKFESCIPIIWSSILCSFFSTLSLRSLNFFSMSVDTSSTSCSFGMVFVAVFLVEVLASFSSRIIVSSVLTSSGDSSWVSGNNTVASPTLSIFAIL